MLNESKKYEERRLRAAIYTRTACITKGCAALEEQEHECRSLAEEKEWAVIDEYVRRDEGKTGMSMDNRAGLNTLLDAVRMKPRPFDVVIVRECHNLGRKLGNVIEIVKTLQQFGVKLYVVAENLDSDDPKFFTNSNLYGMFQMQHSKGI